MPTSDKLARQLLWHGVRKGKIIRANSKPVTKQDIAGLKAYLKWTGAAMDWEDFKRAATGRSGKVSDDVLIAHYNQQGQSTIPRQSSDPDTL